MDLRLFNATHLLNALDENASTLVRFKSSGAIMQIKRHAFRPEIIAGHHLFKISNLRVSPIYVSNTFVDAWAAANLTGLTFDEVWSADRSHAVTSKPQV
jgi:hypothetical protein